MVFRVGISFSVERDMLLPRVVIHDALEALQAIEIEAPTQEVAEHYADLIRLVLEEAGN
jgi:hypothetical protein